MKRILFVSLWCLMIIACTSQQNVESITDYPHTTVTLIVTATPIAETSNQSLEQIIRNVFSPDFSECKSGDNLNEKQDVLEFFKTTLDFNKLIVGEVADSESNKYRAYIATDLTLTLSNCEAGCFAERVYIKNLANGDVYGINWRGYMPARITQHMIWVGDSVLVFWQNINWLNGEIIAVDVEQQKIVYRTLISCN